MEQSGPDMNAAIWQSPEIIRNWAAETERQEPDERKQGLFTEIFERLVPGGWYLNYDPVRAEDPVVEAAWQRTSDLDDPATASRRQHRTPEEQARWENHVRYIIPLAQQLCYLRSAGFSGIDVYWKQLDNVIYGGCRPAD